MNPPLRLLTTFQAAYREDPPRWVLSVPGRELWLAAQPVTRPKYVVVLPDVGVRVALDAASRRRGRTLSGRALPHLLRYWVAMSALWADRGQPLPGSFVVIAGHETPGPRYEYALGLACAVLGCEIHHHPYDEASLQALMEQVEKLYL